MSKKAHDVIKKFFVIKGPELDFLAALFLENGITPRVVCRARLKTGKTVFAHRTGKTIEQLEQLTLESSKQIADQYGYDLISISLPELFTDRELIRALRKAKEEIRNWRLLGGLN